MDLRDLFGIIAIFSIVGVCTYGIDGCMREVREKEAECFAVHKGVDFFEEEPWAKTASGCSVIKVRRYSGKNCNFVDYVFVTDCAGVSWDETVKQGKTTTKKRKSNNNVPSEAYVE